MHRRWVKVLIAVAVVLVVLVLVVPLFINANTFRPELEGQLSSALGRKVTLGHLSFSLFSGSLVADKVSVSEDPAFGTDPFLTAQSLHIGVKTGALLFHKQVEVTNFVADSPVIHLIHAQNGKWNYASLGQGAGGSTAKSQGGSDPQLSGEVKIENGAATVADLPETGKPFVYSGVDLTVKDLSATGSSPFTLTANLQGGGSLKLSGTGGPLAQKDASQTPFNATLVLTHFDPVAAGVVTPSQGISMVADVNARLASNGNTLTSSGKVTANRLQLARTGSPAPRPVDLDYTLSENLAAQTGQVQDIAIHTGQMAAHVTGSYRMTPQAVVLDLRLAAPNLPIDALEQLLPAFGVSLPSGSALHGGTLTANLAITGPATATDIAGPVELDNTRLAGFDLGSKIQGLKAIGGTGGGTEIQTLRGNVNSSPTETQLTNLYGAVPQIGTATGSGTVSPAGALNFHLLAKLNASTGVGALAGGAMSAVGGMLGGVTHTADSNGIPLEITGTTTSPSIRADLGAMLKGQTGGLLGKNTAGQKANPAGLLKGLMGAH